jgi:hypothetical protein
MQVFRTLQDTNNNNMSHFNAFSIWVILQRQMKIVTLCGFKINGYNIETWVACTVHSMKGRKKIKGTERKEDQDSFNK